jgi:hypothetical protein
MNEKIRIYADESMRSWGAVVLDSNVAYRYSPNLWASRQEAGFDFSIDPAALRVFAAERGADVYVCSAAGSDRAMLIVARSADELELRVKRITGLRISDLQLAKPQQPKAPKIVSAPSAANIDEPPSHFCIARTRWFEAHGLKDPLLERPAEHRAPMVDEGAFGNARATKQRH